MTTPNTNLPDPIPVMFDCLRHWLEIYNFAAKPGNNPIDLLKHDSHITILDTGCKACQTFYDCIDCPIADYAAEADCESTPYYDVRDRLLQIKRNKPPKNQKTLLDLIRAEYEFLADVTFDLIEKTQSTQTAKEPSAP